MIDERKAEIATLLQSAQATKWAYGEIKEYWQALSNPIQYGKGMEKWVPDYQYVHELLLDAVALTKPNLYASATFHPCASQRETQLKIGEDIVLLYLNLAKRLIWGQDQVESRRWCWSDFLSDNLDFPAESFDCIVSVFAICHGREISQYERLYANLYRWLKPSGAFVCYDHVCGANEQLTVLNVSAHRSWIPDS